MVHMRAIQAFKYIINDKMFDNANERSEVGGGDFSYFSILVCIYVKFR